MKYFFSILNISICLGSLFSGYGQQTITATILDQKNNTPIPYATVQTGEYQGVVTNDEGKFSISIPEKIQETDSIYISSMGYEKVGIALHKIKDSLIYISPKAIELKSVFVSNKNLTVDQIIDNVKNRLVDNYEKGIHQKKMFFRQSDIYDLKKLNIDFKKSSIEELNEKFIDSVTKTIPRKSNFYIETLCDVYYNKDKTKMKITKAAELYDKNKLGSVDELNDRLEKIFTENIKPDSYLKIKSGLFGTKIQVDSLLQNNEDAAALQDEVEKRKVNGQFLRFRKEVLSMANKSVFFEDESKLNVIKKSNRYSFKLMDYTYFNEQSLYVVRFEPKRSEDFKGVLYINTEDFAIVRIEYENVNPLRNIKLLGIHYRENLYKGKTIFSKGTDGKYTIQYLEHYIGNIVGVDRPLKVIEKNKNVKGRRKQNELSLGVDLIIDNFSKFEVVVFDTTAITSSDYNVVVENKNFEPDYLPKYNPNYWKGHTIIEPNTAIQQFSAIEH